MEPTAPAFTAHNAEAEPWRLLRLARMDGRVREIMRMLTAEPPDSPSPVGETLWARHVLRLHDDRGVLVAAIGAALAESPWLPVLAAVLLRAWEGEDEGEVVLLSPDGRATRANEMLAPLEPLRLPYPR